MELLDERVGVNVEMTREIGDINLAYLLLAQKLIKRDRAAAMLRLGITAELAELLVNMSVSQTVKLANSNYLICGPRLDDFPAFSLFGADKDATLQQAHMSILMAARQLQGREAEATA